MVANQTSRCCPNPLLDSMGTVHTWSTDKHASKTHVHININLSRKLSRSFWAIPPHIFSSISILFYNFCLVSMLILLLLLTSPCEKFLKWKGQNCGCQELFFHRAAIGGNSFCSLLSRFGLCGTLCFECGSLTSYTLGRWQAFPPNMTCLSHSLFRISSSETYWQDLKGDLA